MDQHPVDRPEQSPDYFSSSHLGRGIRRLNNIPLWVLAGLVLLAVFGISYTFFERQASFRLANKQDNKPILNSVAIPPVKPQVEDYIEPDLLKAPESQEIIPEIPTEKKTGSMPVLNEPSPEDIQKRAKLIEEIEQKRLAKWDEALNADAVVQGFRKKNTANENNSSSVGNQPLINPQAIKQLLGGSMGSELTGLPEIPEGGTGIFQNGGMISENQQAQKKAFLENSITGQIYLPHQRQVALSPSQEIKAGTVISGVMISGINSDLPGQILGQVRENVYDTATGKNLLIPVGAKLLGRYDSAITLGQERVLTVWQRIIYPDGSSLSLDNMSGTDQSGYAGFSDEVNNHFGRIFGNALLLSVFSAGVQLSQPPASNGENYNSSQLIAGSLGQQMGQLGMQMANRNMNIQPTLEIRAGYLFNIMVNKDIILPTWTGHPMAKQ